jgi:hypothetical protein
MRLQAFLTEIVKYFLPNFTNYLSRRPCGVRKPCRNNRIFMRLPRKKTRKIEHFICGIFDFVVHLIVDTVNVVHFRLIFAAADSRRYG